MCKIWCFLLKRHNLDYILHEAAGLPVYVKDTFIWTVNKVDHTVSLVNGHILKDTCTKWCTRKWRNNPAPYEWMLVLLIKVYVKQLCNLCWNLLSLTICDKNDSFRSFIYCPIMIWAWSNHGNTVIMIWAWSNHGNTVIMIWVWSNHGNTVIMIWAWGNHGNPVIIIWAWGNTVS